MDERTCAIQGPALSAAPVSTAPPDEASLRRNRLLALLAPGTRAALAPALTHVPLAVRDYMLKEHQPIRHVYFVASGVGSMLASIAGAQKSIEVGTIGKEGMVGLPLFLGATHSPGDCFAQVEGDAFRMDAADFTRAAEEYRDFARVLHRYTQAMMVQVSQSTACNRAHSARQRCARWLLMTHDRVEGDTFMLTQEFLAQMLGERRETVSRVASELQDAGMLQYSRGRLTIVDRARMEEASCPCYAVVRGEYDRMLGEVAQARAE
jgi:CRP-like cAMP-binding protein